MMIEEHSAKATFYSDRGSANGSTQKAPKADAVEAR